MARWNSVSLLLYLDSSPSISWIESTDECLVWGTHVVVLHCLYWCIPRLLPHLTSDFRDIRKPVCRGFRPWSVKLNRSCIYFVSTFKMARDLELSESRKQRDCYPSGEQQEKTLISHAYDQVWPRSCLSASLFSTDIARRIKRIHHWCPVGTGKSQPEGPPFQWETRLRRVSHWNGGPEGWDFPVPLYTSDRFYFSHT